jgi:hypothetical protein
VREWQRERENGERERWNKRWKRENGRGKWNMEERGLYPRVPGEGGDMRPLEAVCSRVAKTRG